MKTILAFALFGLMAFNFVVAPAMIGGFDSAYARQGQDDGDGHDVGDDHGHRR